MKLELLVEKHSVSILEKRYFYGINNLKLYKGFIEKNTHFRENSDFRSDSNLYYNMKTIFAKDI